MGDVKKRNDSTDQTQSNEPPVSGTFGWPYNDALVKFIHSRIHHPHDAEDLAQEAHLRLLRSAPEQVQHLKPYLFKIASNLVADYFRARREPIITYNSQAAEEAAEVADLRNLNPIETQQEDRQTLQDSLNTLSLQTRTVIELSCGDSLSTAEIAQKTGLSKFTVEKYRAKAKKQLREHLKDI